MTDRRLAATLRRHLGETVRLAAPVVVTRAGILTMAAVDAAMLGRTTIEQVAFHGIGIAPFVVISITGVGLLYGTVVMTSHAAGGGHNAQCGAVWRHAIPYAVLLGLGAAILCLFGTPFLALTGQSPAIAAGGGQVIVILGLGIPGTLLFFTTAMFLEGLRRPTPAMIVMIAANVLNVGINWLLIFGHGGFPAMGANGAAWSTSAVRTAMAALLIAYVWWMPDRDRYAVRRTPKGGWWGAGRAHRRIGYAAGASAGIESIAFAALSFFAGLLGPLALAAYTLQHIVFAMIFMVALGVASATSVRVGVAHGRGDRPERALAGWTGLALVVAIMGVIGSLLLLFPGAIAGVLTDDATLIAATAPLVAFSAWALMADGGQVVLGSALRGAGETWAPTAMHVASYFVVMMPAAWLLALSFGHGALGLVEAIVIASVVSVTLLSLRFHAIHRHRG